METNSGLTLTRVAYLGRMGVKVTVITLVVLIVGRTLLGASISYWQATHPAKPPPPTVGFDRLPSLNFPTQSLDRRPTSYQLELPDGMFPDFGDRAKVFLMVKSSPSLLADQRAKAAASNYGFVFAPTILNDRTYRWTKSTTLQSTLEMDIQNLNFDLTSNYLSKPELLAQKDLPSSAEASSLVKSFITTGGQPLGSDIATVSGEISYLKSAGTAVAPAVSFSDADFVQVDVRRAPIDSTFKFFSPEGETGVIHGIIAGDQQSKDRIVELAYRYHPVDYSERQTYPLRSPESAWLVLQAGEGYVARYQGSGTAVIRNVALGYYEDFGEQDYLQPIYVFTGDNNFIGYVPAIDPRWYQGSSTPLPTTTQ